MTKINLKCIFFIWMVIIISQISSKNIRFLDDTSDAASTAAAATQIYSETKEESDATYTSTGEDTSIIKLLSPASVTLTKATLTKTGGDMKDKDKSDFYGINAGVLVTKGSTLTLDSSTVTTNAKGANAIFATGTNAKIIVKNTTITTTGSESSRALDATYGGTITGTDVTIKTTGSSCAALATDRGQGTISCTGCSMETNGSGSPVIYSTGEITLESSTGYAHTSQCVVVEGKNSATVTSSSIYAHGQGKTPNSADGCGVMVYQSMSGDADSGIGTFTCTNSKLGIFSNSSFYSTVPFFFVTNTKATFSLKNCSITYGSGTLMSIKGNLEWGTNGTNGGSVTFTIEGQSISGNIELDSISNLTLYLKNSASFTGAINKDKISTVVSVIIDSTSSWTLSGNSYISSIENQEKIVTGNYNVSYIDGTIIKCASTNGNNTGNNNGTTNKNDTKDDEGNSQILFARKGILYCLILYFLLF